MMMKDRAPNIGFVLSESVTVSPIFTAFRCHTGVWLSPSVTPLFWAEEGAGPQHQSMNGLKALIWSECTHTHKDGRYKDVIQPTHTHTHTLCNSVSSAGFVDSICFVPCHPPSAPHPLWQVEGIQNQDLGGDTNTQSSQRPQSHGHMASVSPTRTSIRTPAVGQCCSAPPCQAGRAASCLSAPPAPRPNTGWGTRADSNTHTVGRYI